jgi:hypothetical protein
MDWLVRLYTGFNKDLFAGECPSPSFNINRSRKAILHFQPPAVLEVGRMATTATMEGVVDDLLHSLVHIYNHIEGVLDHTTHNQYHNQSFADRATSIGLYVAKHKSRGWSLTFVDEKKARAASGTVLIPDNESKGKLAKVILGLQPSDDDLERLKEQVRTVVAGRTAKQYSYKYVCRCASPHNAVRTGRGPESDHALDATCNRCKAQFRLSKD